MDVFGGHFRVERNPDLFINKDVSLCGGIDKNWKGVLQDNI